MSVMYPRSPRVLRPLAALCIMRLLATPFVIAASPAPNYDEALVRPLLLPDVLAGPDEVPAASVPAWEQRSRPHQLMMLEKFVYGRRLPSVPVAVVGKVERADVEIDGVQAVRLQVRLRLGTAAAAPTTNVLVYLPRQPGEHPLFLKLNFRGNQAETEDRGVWLPEVWMPTDDAAGIVGNRATEASRGKNARRFPVAAMVGRGYGMATAYCGDFFPDRPDGRPDSVLKSLGRPLEGGLPADEPGAIAAWSWGLSRILDWLITLPAVDAGKVIVVGHSRLGKTALWAGATDPRFAMIVSNESGCGGAALSRRNYGETIAVITQRFPHWFCPTLASYADREIELPCDQHALLALAAPRPLYVSSAEEDRWADPRGEFLAAVAASPVWKLYGRVGLGTEEYPAVDTPIGETIGYHVRRGKHDLLLYDWTQFADFADRRLLGRQPPPAAATLLPPSLRQRLVDFTPVQSPLPVAPPTDAVVLLGPGVPPRFVSMSGNVIDWTGQDGELVVTRTKQHANHIVSTEHFQDADIHAEFMTAAEAHGNSGLYIHGHYEMQIYDSFGVAEVTQQDEGSLYRFAKPLVNAALPTGEWQVYDVRYFAPRHDAAGNVVRAGTLRAWLNGKLVQDGVTFTQPRSPYIPFRHGVTDFLRAVEKELANSGQGPLFLQDHGSPVRFRNVWIRRHAGD